MLWTEQQGCYGSYTHNHLTALGPGLPRVGRYQKKHSPTHTRPDHHTSFINFLHLLRSIASSVFSLHAWQSFLTTSLRVLFGLALGLGPCTSYSMHFFTNHHVLFTPHAHAISACSAVIPMLCHLYLISLSAPYLEIRLLAMDHSR